ncbi:MAG: hypothetical protein MJ074_06850 [Oscillospiraceae bacterium]|nr:hypothetical protein [Oscillospiraceae bacterium]
MRVGDKLMLEPTIATSYGAHHAGRTLCEVIWIHPLGRFFKVRFQGNCAGWTECFRPEDLDEEAVKVPERPTPHGKKRKR